MKTNKNLLQEFTIRNAINKIFQYSGIFCLGFGMSFFVTQKVNDVFYETVIKGRAILSENDFKDDIIPKSVFYKNPKQTFVKHKIEASPKDESIIYQNFIELKKSDIDYDKELKLDIFEKRENKNKANDRV